MAEPPRILVVAGTNGCGKSSLLGEALLELGIPYFNPDLAAKRLLAANPSLSQTEANSQAWHEGKNALEQHIAQRRSFNFETTLGGRTIVSMLAEGVARGIEIIIWYAGLASPELHIARVKARVARGGHDIPEDVIRRRYDASRENLIRLLPRITELRLFDNSVDADPEAGHAPRPRPLMEWRGGKIGLLAELAHIPDWAKPIVAAALRLQSPAR